ncbi:MULTISPECIES: TIGR03089 family protein [Paenarthrobacter]|uniref:TIGR03089 family protein n=1 Tax=Paenarthrobacter ureafaciens TaxID=37931 RepID=A0AAX3ELM7_PAEUR|nr:MULTISPECIES: TIGR03089 family protein [Paenarthrobacter]NKR10985.1 TIGR03089 family protein [Arthrobacter sp. M5]NKR17442.1 TIGR03089 family protein [Arthrobacter sp. M6]OEH63987.1 TIGR03089 family protein [Arthrobacter sp. D4]OEH64700.1 TIGR03089 family protein [Arthrobacter sp. D2]MDO5863886.1 TIGR03089 family protein [Paenarthrobacter sp. SD-2]
MSIPAANLMSALRSGHSTSPRLTWYGPDSERVELSGRVLDNWVAKTSNLLQDELDAEPGTAIRIDLPAHWKSFVWALAAWQLGMEVVLDGSAADLLVTNDPSDHTGAAYDAVVAVPLAALAMSWPGELPPGVVDYAAEVRSHGDVFMVHNEPTPELAAVRGNAGYAHADLMEQFAEAAEPGVRLLVRASEGLESGLSAALGAWQGDGSVVLVHEDVDVTEHLLENERVSRP